MGAQSNTDGCVIAWEFLRPLFRPPVSQQVFVYSMRSYMAINLTLTFFILQRDGYGLCWNPVIWTHVGKSGKVLCWGLLRVWGHAGMDMLILSFPNSEPTGKWDFLEPQEALQPLGFPGEQRTPLCPMCWEATSVFAEENSPETSCSPSVWHIFVCFALVGAQVPDANWACCS